MGGEPEAVRRVFAVGLAQQGVEAVVEAGAEAQVGGVARAVRRAVVVLPGRREQPPVLVVVGGGLVEVVLLEGGQQRRLVLKHRAAAVQAARAAVAGHLERAHITG